MNRELEHELAEMGLSDVVDALRSAPQARVDAGFSTKVMDAVRSEQSQSRRAAWWRRLTIASLLPVAACLALCAAVGSALFRSDPVCSTDRLLACQRTDGTFTASSAAAYAQAFAVTVLAKNPTDHAAALNSAVAALVRDQDASGGWSNASLTARNVTALRLAADAGVAGARRAYRQGLRYLRAHGLVEMSAEELSHEAHAAATRLGPQADNGLVCSLTLCAAG